MLKDKPALYFAVKVAHPPYSLCVRQALYCPHRHAEVFTVGEFIRNLLDHSLAWAGGILTALPFFDKAIERAVRRWPQLERFVTDHIKDLRKIALVCILVACYLAWNDEHNNSTTLIREKADVWSRFNACDKQLASKSTLSDTLAGQVGSQQVQWANQQDTFNRCVLTLQRVSIPERQKFKVKTTGTFSVTDPQGKDTLVWLVVAFTNKTIPNLHAKLVCTENFVFQKFDIVEGGPLPAAKVGFSRVQVSGKQVNVSLQSPLWNPESPLLFMLTTEEKTSKLGECAISLD